MPFIAPCEALPMLQRDHIIWGHHIREPGLSVNIFCSGMQEGR